MELDAYSFELHWEYLDKSEIGTVQQSEEKVVFRWVTYRESEKMWISLV